jgi:hypothetical protein
MYFRHASHFDFTMHTSTKDLQVTVDVRCAWIYFTRAFRIAIDGEVIYAEGKWPEAC